MTEWSRATVYFAMKLSQFAFSLNEHQHCWCHPCLKSFEWSWQDIAVVETSYLKTYNFQNNLFRISICLKQLLNEFCCRKLCLRHNSKIKEMSSVRPNFNSSQNADKVKKEKDAKMTCTSAGKDKSIITAHSIDWSGAAADEGDTWETTRCGDVRRTALGAGSKLLQNWWRGRPNCPAIARSAATSIYDQADSQR